MSYAYLPTVASLFLQASQLPPQWEGGTPARLRIS